MQNSYFPLFITEDVLNTEKDHVEGFAPEVAWVTKYGNSTMEKPIAIRPTSETVRAGGQGAEGAGGGAGGGGARVWAVEGEGGGWKSKREAPGRACHGRDLKEAGPRCCQWSGQPTRARCHEPYLTCPDLSLPCPSLPSSPLPAHTHTPR